MASIASGVRAVASQAPASGVPYHTLLKIVKGETTDPRISTVASLLEWSEREVA